MTQQPQNPEDTRAPDDKSAIATSAAKAAKVARQAAKVQAESEDVAALIDADRELTPSEQSRLRAFAAAGWSFITDRLQHRARDAYALSEPGDFAECVFDHMDVNDRAAMIAAEVYQCPDCARLLKDRRSTASSSILLERGRLRDLWLAAEQAPAGEAREEALTRFRSALGLGRQ
jgi:hypothetical protein